MSTTSETSGLHSSAVEDYAKAIYALQIRDEQPVSTTALAERLGLSQGVYQVCFQSRLGRTPWIRPYTDLLLAELPKRGVRGLAVVFPFFVAACLETLGGVGLRGRGSFLSSFGEELVLVPSLNAHPRWVQAVVRMARRAAA